MKTIIEMAREADAYASNEHTRLRNEAIHEEYLDIDWREIRDKRFAALVRAEAQAEEREECAKVCEEFARKWWSIHGASNKHIETTRKAHDDFCALQAAIRARGNK